MNSFAPQYIGITGFMEPFEIEAIQNLMDPDGPKLMVGLLVSGKTLRGQTNKYPNQYPKVGRLAELLDAIDTSVAYGLIHYSTDSTALYDELHWILDIIQDFPKPLPKSLAGFQYNLLWPRPRYLQKTAAYCSSESENWINQSILQLGPIALEDKTPAIVERLIDYDTNSNPEIQPILSHALIDMSGGVGKILEPRRVHDLLMTLIEEINLQHLRWAVAGGLDADNMTLLRPLAYIYPQLSVDAQGRLRDPETDKLDLDKAKRYVEAAQLLLSGQM